MPITVYEALAGKGAMEVLCEIDPAGSQYTELTEEVGISHSTVGDRLGELKEASLVHQTATTGGRGTTNLYGLTPKGATFRRALEESGTVLAYRQLKEARKQFADKETEMQEWARSELDKFTEEQHENHLSLLQDDQKFNIPEGDFQYEDSQNEDEEDTSQDTE